MIMIPSIGYQQGLTTVVVCLACTGTGRQAGRRRCSITHGPWHVALSITYTPVQSPHADRDNKPCSTYHSALWTAEIRQPTNRRRV